MSETIISPTIMQQINGIKPNPVASAMRELTRIQRVSRDELLNLGDTEGARLVVDDVQHIEWSLLMDEIEPPLELAQEILADWRADYDAMIERQQFDLAGKLLQEIQLLEIEVLGFQVRDARTKAGEA